MGWSLERVARETGVSLPSLGFNQYSAELEMLLA